MKLFVLALVVVSAIGLGGCANVPREPIEKDLEAKAFRQPEKGMSHLYLVRNTAFGQTSTLELSINGLPVAKTSPRTYVKFNLPAGQYFIGSRGENYDQKPIVLIQGKNHYMWQRVWTGWNDFRTELVELSEKDGKNAVLESSLVVKLVDDKFLAPVPTR